MMSATRDWVAKAEGDFVTMEREYRARKAPNYDGLCFHAQQCAEKYIKARLVEDGQEPRKIHNLVALLEDVLPLEPGWEQFREDLAQLTALKRQIDSATPFGRPVTDWPRHRI